MRFSFHPKHKNLLLFLLGFGVAYLFWQSRWFGQFLLNLGNFGYLSAILAGALFVSTFTVATGALILMTLARSLSPAELILFAAIGAVLGDFLIFRFVKDDVVGEITPIYDSMTGSHFKKILHTRYFAWTLPVIGALIIISPFPDELGVSLMGLSEIKTSKFLLISGISHLVGMFMLVSASLVV